MHKLIIFHIIYRNSFVGVLLNSEIISLYIMIGGLLSIVVVKGVDNTTFLGVYVRMIKFSWVCVCEFPSGFRSDLRT